MGLFDRTESGFVEQKVRETVNPPTIGRVVSVQEHTDPTDFSNHEASVILRDESTQLRNVPIAQMAIESSDIPKEDDLVIIQFLSGDIDRPIITQRLHSNEIRAPLAKEGMFRRKWGNLFLEAYSTSQAGGSPDEEWVRISRKDTDDADYDGADAAVEIDDTDTNGTKTRAKAGNASVEIDDTGASTTVSIQSDGDVTINVTSGDVNIDASGKVNLQGGGAGVARVGDAVEVDDPDSGTITGTITEGSSTVESG